MPWGVWASTFGVMDIRKRGLSSRWLAISHEVSNGIMFRTLYTRYIAQPVAKPTAWANSPRTSN